MKMFTGEGGEGGGSRFCEGGKEKTKPKVSFGKTPSENGHDWTFQSHRGLWKTKNGQWTDGWIGDRVHVF